MTYHDPGALKHPTCLVGGAPFRRPSSAKAASSAGSRSGLSDSHWVRAALTPDGSRAFQIDGKQKSAAQVKVGARSRDEGGLWLCGGCTRGAPTCCPTPASLLSNHMHTQQQNQVMESRINNVGSHILSSCYHHETLPPQEFLRAHGLHLDQPTAVIRQAAVTHLADCNDPAAVGKYSAKGLGQGSR